MALIVPRVSVVSPRQVFFETSCRMQKNIYVVGLRPVGLL